MGNACKYCGYEHGVIGDVICPIKKRFPYTEKLLVYVYKYSVWSSYTTEVDFRKEFNFSSKMNRESDAKILQNGFRSYLIEIDHKYTDAYQEAYYPSTKQKLKKYKL